MWTTRVSGSGGVALVVDHNPGNSDDDDDDSRKAKKNEKAHGEVARVRRWSSAAEK